MSASGLPARSTNGQDGRKAEALIWRNLVGSGGLVSGAQMRKADMRCSLYPAPTDPRQPKGERQPIPALRLILIPAPLPTLPLLRPTRRAKVDFALVDYKRPAQGANL